MILTITPQITLSLDPKEIKELRDEILMLNLNKCGMLGALYRILNENFKLLSIVEVTDK